MMQNVSNLIAILPMLGSGLLGVFFVIARIWRSIAALAKFCK